MKCSEMYIRIKCYNEDSEAYSKAVSLAFSKSPTDTDWTDYLYSIRLSMHDTYYTYSDQLSTWQAGERESKALKEIKLNNPNIKDLGSQRPELDASLKMYRYLDVYNGVNNLTDFITVCNILKRTTQITDSFKDVHVSATIRTEATPNYVGDKKVYCILATDATLTAAQEICKFIKRLSSDVSLERNYSIYVHEDHVVFNNFTVYF